jgi:outer membrane receptor protein involved in Fe transport
VAEQGSKDLSQDEQLTTSVTKILARHTIKAGFSVIYDSHWNDGATSPQRGQYNFTTTYNPVIKDSTGAQIGGGPNTGYADFLLGYPDSTAKTSPNNFISRNQMAQYGAYLQDDWKLSSKFTINFGIRYDVQKFRPSLYGNDALYVPGLQKVVVFENSYNSASSVVSARTPITLLLALALPTISCRRPSFAVPMASTSTCFPVLMS